MTWASWLIHRRREQFSGCLNECLKRPGHPVPLNIWVSCLSLMALQGSQPDPCTGFDGFPVGCRSSLIRAALTFDVAQARYQRFSLMFVPDRRELIWYDLVFKTTLTSIGLRPLWSLFPTMRLILCTTSRWWLLWKESLRFCAVSSPLSIEMNYCSCPPLMNSVDTGNFEAAIYSSVIRCILHVASLMDKAHLPA